LKTLVLYLFPFLFSFTALAQESYRRQTYTSNDGLPSSQVYKIFQDSRDYLWIGTSAGLSRFDGHSFRNFGPLDGLEGSQVMSIGEDKKGRLWIGTSSALFLYNGIHFTKVVYDFVDIQDLLAIGDSLWMATRKGLFLLDIERRKLSKYTEKQGLSSANTTCLLRDADGSLLIGTAKGMDRLAGSFSSWWNAHEENYIMNVGLDRNNNIWFGTLFGSTYCNRQLVDQVVDTTHPTIPRAIFRGEHSDIWIAHEYDFYVYANGRLKRKVPVLEEAINGMMDGLRDREGNYWAATPLGLVVLRPSFVTAYPLPPQGAAGLYQFPGDTNIYLSTCQQILRVTADTLIDAFPGKPPLLGCTEIFAAENNGFLVGTRFGDLRRYRNGTWHNLGNHAVWSAYRSGDNIWLGGIDEILTTAGDSLIHFGFTDGSPSVLKFLSICPLNDTNSFLLGSQNGLYRFDNGKFTLLSVVGVEKRLMITDICNVGNNRYLLATKGYGILAITIVGNKAVLNDALNTRNGLGANFISHLTLDSQGNIWVVTMNGIYRICNYFGKRSIEYIGKNDGLPENSWTIGSLLVDHKGMVYVAGSAGLVRFPANAPFTSPAVQRTYLSGIVVNNREFNWDLADSLRSFSGFPTHFDFPYSSNSVSFSFTGINFYKPALVRYEYFLEGYNTAPVQSLASFASFNDLSPGSYIFKVRSTANQEFGNEPYASFSFTVSTPFWLSWWFRIAMLLLAAALIYGIYRWRIREHIKKQDLQVSMARQLNESRMQAFQARMNPHFIFNSLNAIQYFIMKDDKMSTMNYISRFARLLRQILDNTLAAKVNLDKEIEMLRSYIEIEELRFDHRFSYHIEVEEGLNPTAIEIPGMVIQPFVENAILHGLLHKESKGSLTIRFSPNGGLGIVCVVEDNGVGRKASAALNHKKASRHQSHGTSIAVNRLSLLNDREKGIVNDVVFTDLEEDDIAFGTKVTIYIPIL
jgi:ligand-binding sensor domain-containing protein